MCVYVRMCARAARRAHCGHTFGAPTWTTSWGVSDVGGAQVERVIAGLHVRRAAEAAEAERRRLDAEARRAAEAAMVMKHTHAPCVRGHPRAVQRPVSHCARPHHTPAKCVSHTHTFTNFNTVPCYALSINTYHTPDALLTSRSPLLLLLQARPP